MKDKIGQLPFIIAMNDDGFGVRLCALINAITVSKSFDIPFLFTWHDSSKNLFHSVLPVERTFSINFIDSHFYEGKVTDYKQWYDLRLDSEYSGFYRSYMSLDSFRSKRFNKGRGGLDRKHQHLAFKEIEFSEELQIAIDAARSVDLPRGSIAIHLRGGDIVNGSMRQSGYYVKKVISYPIALKLIRDFKSSGKEVVFFSQDDELGKSIAALHSHVIWSKSICPPDFNRSQSAMFDIILMSRCSMIFAGHSGFSVSASYIGDVDIVDVMRDDDNEGTFLKDIARELSDRFLMSRFPSLHVAYAHLAALTVYQDRLELEDALRLSSQGQEFDGKNLFFLFNKFLIYWSSGDRGHADEVLRTITSIDRLNTLDLFLRTNLVNKSLRSHFLKRGFLAALERAMQAGSKEAAIILVMCHYYVAEITSEENLRSVNKLISGAGFESMHSFLKTRCDEFSKNFTD